MSAGGDAIKSVDDEGDIIAVRKGGKIYSWLNYLGVFLLVGSSTIIFTPFLELFPSIAPNGYEALIWIAWGIGIFIFSIILLIVTNVLKSVSRS